MGPIDLKILSCDFPDLRTFTNLVRLYFTFIFIYICFVVFFFKFVGDRAWRCTWEKSLRFCRNWIAGLGTRRSGCFLFQLLAEVLPETIFFCSISAEARRRVQRWWELTSCAPWAFVRRSEPRNERWDPRDPRVASHVVCHRAARWCWKKNGNLI